MKGFFEYLEGLRPLARSGDWDGVEQLGREGCVKLAKARQTSRIEAVDFAAYEKALKEGWREALAKARDISAQALYFEFDLDTSFFFCNDYAPEEEEQDDWAGDWDEYAEGPSFDELGELYQTKEGTFDESDLSRGTTLYLVARTIAACGRSLPARRPGKLPCCAAFHDQPQPYRLGRQ